MKKSKVNIRKKPSFQGISSREAVDSGRFEEVGDVDCVTSSSSPRRPISRQTSRSLSVASSCSLNMPSSQRAKSPRSRPKRSSADNRYIPKVGMDAYERRVVQRKRPLIAEKFGFTPEDQKKYRRLGMLGDDIIGDIMVEPDEYHQCLRYLELLPEQAPSMFHLFLEVLTEGGHGWIAEEMKIELLSEKGKLELEGYVYREAGVVVNRQFAGNLRLAQSDVKEIQLLLGMRYQVAKDSWYEQMIRVHDDLKQALDSKWMQNNKMKGLAQNIATFIKLQKPSLNEYAHDMVDNDVDFFRDDLDPENKKKDYYHILQKTVNNVLEVVSKLILEKENLLDEKDRCIKVLKLKKPVRQLDLAIEEALIRASEDSVRMRSQYNLSDSMARNLETKLKNLKVETGRQLADQQEKLMYWESLALQREERIMRLDRQMAELEQKRTETDEEASKWKERCVMLEKTKRLGYYHTGWHDRMYGMGNIDYGRLRGDVSPPPLVALVPKNRKGSHSSVLRRTTQFTALNVNGSGMATKKNGKNEGNGTSRE